jgi:hypothetical protein
VSNLRELRSAPEPFRTRPDEPEPVRAFTGYFNGRRDPKLYRACLVRHGYHEHYGWCWPDTTWGVSLCDRDAYPYRWHGLIAQYGEYAVPEVADMELCSACARVLQEESR